MKKILFLMLTVIGLGLSACHHECQDCDCALGVHNKICRDDYDSKDDYEDAIRDAEDSGCDCDIDL